MICSVTEELSVERNRSDFVFRWCTGLFDLPVVSSLFCCSALCVKYVHYYTMEKIIDVICCSDLINYKDSNYTAIIIDLSIKEMLFKGMATMFADPRFFKNNTVSRIHSNYQRSRTFRRSRPQFDKDMKRNVLINDEYNHESCKRVMTPTNFDNLPTVCDNTGLGATGGRPTYAEVVALNTDYGSESLMGSKPELTQDNTLDISQDNSNDLHFNILEYPLHATDVPNQKLIKVGRRRCKPVLHLDNTQDIAQGGSYDWSPPNIRRVEGVDRPIPSILKGKSFECIISRNLGKILVYEDSNDEISVADVRALIWWMDDNPLNHFDPGDILYISMHDYRWHYSH